MKREYVLGFMYSENYDHVALIRKTKPDWQAGNLNGIGGKVEKDEFGKEAMVREFREETGMQTTDVKWRYFATMQNSQFDVACYSTTGDLSLLKTTTEEEVVIVSIHDLYRHKTNSNVKWLVAMGMDKGFHPVTIDYLEADKYTEK